MLPHAIIDPCAVMVILFDAYFTNRAMVLAGSHLADTYHAEMKETGCLGELGIVGKVSWQFAVLEDQTSKYKKSDDDE